MSASFVCREFRSSLRLRTAHFSHRRSSDSQSSHSHCLGSPFDKPKFPLCLPDAASGRNDHQSPVYMHHRSVAFTQYRWMVLYRIKICHTFYFVFNLIGKYYCGLWDRINTMGQFRLWFSYKENTFWCNVRYLVRKKNIWCHIST